MDSFKPSADFVSRTMGEVRSYERETRHRSDRLNAFLLSKQMRFALSAGAILFGMLNLIRIASILFSPALCL
jgi:hypothetical protein